MNFFDYMRSWFNYATQVFVYLALESYSSWYVPDAMGDFFNYLSDFTARISGYLYDASSWYDYVTGRIGDVLSWSTIWDYITSYIPNLTQIRDWFYGVTSNILSVVDTWWSSTQWTVRGWIDSAVDGLQALSGTLSLRVTTLRSDVDNLLGQLPGISTVLIWFSDWRGNVLAAVDTWWSSAMGDVQDLIDSAFQARSSLWSGWQEIRMDVLTFIQDPMQFIWDRFVDWFLGPEV